MSFNINEFKSRMDQFGGPALTSLFTVEFISTAGNPYIRDNELLFFCKNATLPGIDVSTISYRQNAIDIPQAIPTAINAEPLTCIFMLDSDHRVLSFFHAWMQKVVNYSTQGGSFSSVNDQLPYELGYKDEYSSRMLIKYYSTNSSKNLLNYYEVILDGVYPTTVQNIDLAWENNDSIATLPVAFSYDRIQYSAEVKGIAFERISRGNGILDIIARIGAVGQLIDEPLEDVQDALNRFTRIGNLF